MPGQKTIANCFHILAATTLASCVTPAQQLGEHPTEQQLDEWSIDNMTNTRIRTGVQGYDAVSGRIMELLLVVSKEMAEKHEHWCGKNPLPNNIFFYKEDGDVLRVQTAPRYVPDDRPPPKVPEGHVYLSITPKNSRTLDGCEIQFVVDKKTKEIISTNVMR